MTNVTPSCSGCNGSFEIETYQNEAIEYDNEIWHRLCAFAENPAIERIETAYRCPDCHVLSKWRPSDTVGSLRICPDCGNKYHPTFPKCSGCNKSFDRPLYEHMAIEHKGDIWHQACAYIDDPTINRMASEYECPNCSASIEWDRLPELNHRFCPECETEFFENPDYPTCPGCNHSFDQAVYEYEAIEYDGDVWHIGCACDDHPEVEWVEPAYLCPNCKAFSKWHVKGSGESQRICHGCTVSFTGVRTFEDVGYEGPIDDCEGMLPRSMQ